MFHRPTMLVRVAVAATLLTPVALLPHAAQAQGPGYSYVDAAYIQTEIDGVDSDADGFLLRGSFGITDEVFASASYSDQGIRGIDLQQYDVGVGYAWSVADTTDLYGRVSYVRAEAQYRSLSVDDDGYGLGIGIRSFVTGQLELEAVVNYTDLSESGDDTSFGVGARWYFTEQLAAGVEAEFGDDVTSYGLGMRFSFGD